MCYKIIIKETRKKKDITLRVSFIYTVGLIIFVFAVMFNYVISFLL